jgi:hypothetical protein
MGYSGQTFVIPCSDMGYNANPNIDNVPINAMVSPSRNVNIHEGGIGKRGGTAHVDAAVNEADASFGGIFDFSLTSGSQYIIRATSTGTIYRDYQNTIATSLGTNKKYSFAVMNDILHIANGYNQVQIWTGSGNTSNITSASADWTSTNQPEQLIVHGRYNSERMWGIGVSGKKNFLYYSADNAGTGQAAFTGSGSGQIYIETGDGAGLTAMAEFQDRLIVFSKRNSFVLEDTDATPANWGYISSGWFGGAAHWRLICITPNDIVAMMEDGEIYSVTAAQTYGDYKSASLTRPAFIHKYIKDNVDLSYINNFHMIYDPVLRCINIFVVRTGHTTVDTALCYFIDRSPDKAWAIKDNQNYSSGWSASASAIVRKSAGAYKVYTGDYSGYVWELETNAKNDNSSGYYAGIKIPHQSFGNARLTKRFDNVRAVVIPKGNYDINVSVLIDGAQSMTGSMSMAGIGSYLGSFVLGTDVLGGLDLIDTEIKIGDVGKRISVELYNAIAGEDFFISQLLFDFKTLGVTP